MSEVLKTFGSLVSPFFGFVRALFSGAFGVGQIFNFANQVLWQSVIVGALMHTAGFGTVFTIATLVGVHVFCAFLVLTMYLGSAFTRGGTDQHQAARESYIVAAAVSSVLGFVFLGSVSLFTHTPFINFVGAFVVSALIGAAIDVVAIFSLVGNAQANSAQPAPAVEPAPAQAPANETPEVLL